MDEELEKIRARIDNKELKKTDDIIEHNEKVDVWSQMTSMDKKLEEADREVSTEESKAVNRNRDAKIDASLEHAIKNARNINDKDKESYLKMAAYFTSDFENNMFASQFRLAEIYPEFGFDEWTNFLSEQIIAIYLNKHKTMFLRTSAEAGMKDPYAKNKNANLNVINGLNNQEFNDNQQNIVVFRIPLKNTDILERINDGTSDDN